MTSFLFADPGDLRAIAHHISGHADQIRRQAASLVAAAASARWYSPAANSFRHQVTDIALDLRRAADELDAAAAAMRNHADEVGTALEIVSASAHAAVGVVEHAGKSVLHVGASALHAIGL